MRKIFLALVAVIMFAFQSAQASPSPQWVKNLPAAKSSTQMIVVAWIKDSDALVSMHEKINGNWEQIMETAGFVGRKGIGKTRQGDGKSPRGTFTFNYAFGIAPDPGCAIPYLQVNGNHYWSGDLEYKYNQLVDARKVPANFDYENSEHLIDFNPAYLYALNISYNSEGKPGKGFALYLRCFEPDKTATGGSVMIPEDKMLFVMQHVKKDCVCVIDSLRKMGGDQLVQATPSPQWIKNLPAAQNSEQMIVVAGIQGTTAWISMHERNSSGKWEEIMTTPGFIGKNGLGKVKEGDNKTPVGTFYFNFAFGIAPDPGCAIPYVQVDENHYWSGDWNYKYNQFVDVREAPANFETRYSEHLIDYNPHYTYGLNMGYNAECTPGKGSALFMHCFGPAKPWTGGCVGLPNDKMLFVMKHIRPGCVCVIDSLQNLGGAL